MSRRALAFAFGLGVVVGAGTMWFAGSRKPPAASPPAAPAPVVAAPRSEPASAAAAAPEPSAERTTSTLPRPARRTPAPKEPEATKEPAAAALTGTLHISSDIVGAQVFIDRNYIGVAPVTSPEIILGSHRLNIIAQGYDAVTETIEVEQGSRDLQFNFKEVRLDAAVDVVHKHRFGSCKGRLVATPQGLRYDSDDKNDRFTLALTDLELFEVDYLAKTLKVQGVKGKKYEFSDPTAANGDRLFVFHRNVDKARQRLKQGS
jgi:PEGA domain